MNYTIKKGSSNTLYLFIVIGIFLILAFSYQLYDYLNTNQFVFEFPGDWDKPLGIVVGIFLIVRSRKFVNRAKGLFIKISENELIYRTKESESVQKIKLSDIEQIQGSENGVILKIKSSKSVIIDLDEIKSGKEKRLIRKSLIESIKN
ncbi:hypothetical protein [Aquimarina sp. 2201CG5-10]|uniref:hypothetical protein n=1 Tax=Aquimarina callyspongiae TaxID=3098150 RepID=UPI002AB5B08E|nr:hypothetical protein [Aquimarina sp. 2201CG5-10]MDY8135389.1 hypothetical protein [Aquimarina sp. 2201CG5-10]